MKITQGHLNLLMHQRYPTIYSRVEKGIVRLDISIDALINTQVASPESRGRASTMAILRSARKRGALVAVLSEMARSPMTTINPKRRAADCRKWLRRIR